MIGKRHIILVLCTICATGVWAQKAERDNIRKGNRLYADSAYVDAEVKYRKALDINPSSTVAMFNLGNTMLQQQKAKEALEMYVAASKIEKDKSKLAQIYHNMGVLFHLGKDYAKAVEAYKRSLRNNPKDDETRYNFVLAQKMLKDQQQNEQNQDKQNQQKEQDKKNNQEKEQKQDQQQNNQQPPKQNNDTMSKENAEQLLKSVLQDERDVQEKVKKQQIMQGHKLEKDW